MDALREDVREINQRLDRFAQGMLEKMKGDTQLAAQVGLNKELLSSLDEVVVRGTTGSSSIKSEVENLRKEVDHLSEVHGELKQTVDGIRREDAALQVARITSQSANWKATAVLIGTFLTALAGLIIAIWKM
jgi:conjugal transfer/entry exclusion protein